MSDNLSRVSAYVLFISLRIFFDVIIASNLFPQKRQVSFDLEVL